MVLVMISTTSCLFIGSEDALRNQNPRDINVDGFDVNTKSGQQILENVKQTMLDEKIKTSDWVSYCFREVDFEKSEKGLTSVRKNTAMENIVSTKLITIEEYNRMENKQETLEQDEVFVYSPNLDYKKGEQLFAKEEYRVAKQLTKLSVQYDYVENFKGLIYVVVPSEKQLFDLVGQSQNGEVEKFNFYLGVNVDITDKQEIALSRKVMQKIDNQDNLEYLSLSSDCMADSKEDFLSIYGGLFFLGIFLGLLFTMAMVLIIYYKQISEGYDDKKRFEIMQKVGMSKWEVKKSIQSQVKTVFFLPLVTAVIHLAFAFKMIRKLLSVLNLTNVGLFITCTIVTTAIFVVLYAVVYLLTAKIYYRIVES